MTETPDDFMEAYESTANSHDLEATLALIDEEAVFLFSDESVHVGKSAIARALQRNFDLIQDETYSIADLTWLVETEEVAVCVYDFSWTGIIHGKPASGSGRGTTVLQRFGRSWKVIHEHLSRGAFAERH
jgi:ketosteroid isomerase-like protein